MKRNRALIALIILTRRWSEGGRTDRIGAWAGRMMLVVLLLSGCGAPTGGRSPGTARFEGDHPIEIACTTGMVADIVRNVGGAHVEVTALMGEGVDPHLYKPSPGDITALSNADMIFYSGLHLEGKMGDIFERMRRRKPTVPVAEGIAPDRLLHTSGGTVDPHVWFDVMLWSKAVETARSALESFDPAHADDYSRNAEAYRARLAELDQSVGDRIAEIPEDHRVLVTAHDAFGYFGRAYGMEVRGIQGISTESEAGVREINELVAFLADREIKAVFVESSVSDRNIQALVEGCRARGHEVVIGGQLYSDAMGKAGTPEGTYIGMVRHNVETITEALK